MIWALPKNPCRVCGQKAKIDGLCGPCWSTALRRQQDPSTVGPSRATTDRYHWPWLTITGGEQ